MIKFKNHPVWVQKLIERRMLDTGKNVSFIQPNDSIYLLFTMNETPEGLNAWDKADKGDYKKLKKAVKMQGGIVSVLGDKYDYYIYDNKAESTTELIRRWSENINLHTADPIKQFVKLAEEMGELAEGLAKGKEYMVTDAIGDMYVVMTILAQQLGHNIEDCIEAAYIEIKDRKGRMVNGVFVKESDI